MCACACESTYAYDIHIACVHVHVNHETWAKGRGYCYLCSSSLWILNRVPNHFGAMAHVMGQSDSEGSFFADSDEEAQDRWPSAQVVRCPLTGDLYPQWPSDFAEASKQTSQVCQCAFCSHQMWQSKQLKKVEQFWRETLQHGFRCFI